MNPEIMTERVQQAFSDAQALAQTENHQEIDDIHLFLAILERPDNLLSSVLEKLTRIQINLSKS